jgi:1-acyl-sn-glycerol-3-phosphate acyltransferase
LIFPEGTRSRDGTLRNFKKGAFVLAINTGMPVVPLAVVGTREVLQADKLGIKRGAKIKLLIGTPVTTHLLRYQDRDKLCAQVQLQVYLPQKFPRATCRCLAVANDAVLQFCKDLLQFVLVFIQLHFCTHGSFLFVIWK